MTELSTRDDDEELRRAARSGPVPGIIQIFSPSGPESIATQVQRRPLTIGRSIQANITIDDDLLSRTHCEVAFDGARWIVRDFGSRNNTYVDGKRVQGVGSFDDARTLRLGSSLFVFDPDIARFRRGPVTVDGGRVIGPMVQGSLGEIADAAKEGKSLLVTGETGTGKEFAAHYYRLRSPTARGPFIVINCAELPQTLAESQLFGARKGAYSGCDRDIVGFVWAANDGVLFLDEIGELDLSIQAKLLRVIETKRVTRLGDTESRPLNIHFVAATNRDLRDEVRRGRFRADLRFRIAQAEVCLPPIRERPEEIPFFIKLFAKNGPPPDVRFVEACLLRPWEGNARDLEIEVGKAAKKAAGEGADKILVDHLAPLPPGSPARVLPAASAQRPKTGPVTTSRRVTDVELREAWEVHKSATAVARAVGMVRSQVYVRLKRLGLIVGNAAPAGESDDGDEGGVR
jgi:transcriptional regulator with AAA-type ATPase domain